MKTFSFSLKTEGNTNYSLKLKLKVFQRKPSVFFLKRKVFKDLPFFSKTEGNTKTEVSSSRTQEGIELLCDI